MPYETFDLRLEDCGHTTNIPLQHNSDHDRCFPTRLLRNLCLAEFAKETSGNEARRKQDETGRLGSRNRRWATRR